ncbi:hypothetical protein [Hamadaea tsunoensis]|uniref:hypothetical protein n=1 Tax=Hamadaea tsunoensis TaxID=53368 RepID=UPI0003FD9235|nr:hypothetical protein [Hamadaea tsunoensis]
MIPPEDTYSGTSWYVLDVPTMWSYISGINLDPMYTQSSGWDKAIDLASTNLWRLKDFRDKLTQAWPPEKSQASQEYVGKLDELITSVQDVYDAAVANKTSASNLTSSLSEAQYKVKPLYDEYLKNMGTQSTYEQNLTSKKTELANKYTAGSNSYKSALAAWQRSNPDPATAARQAQITDTVRQTMSGLSTDLVVSSGKMVEPKPYTPPQIAGRDTGGSKVGGGSDGDTGGGSTTGSGSNHTAPVIPPPVFLPPTTTGPSLTGTTTLPPPVAPTPMPTAPISTLPSTPPGTGPIGMVPPVAPVGPGGLINPPPNPTGPLTTFPGGKTGPGVIGGRGLTGVPGEGPMGGGRVNPVGGVIGRQGATGGMGPMGGARGGSVRGVNPAGGVIGGRGGAAGRTGPGVTEEELAGRGGRGGVGGRGAGMVGGGVGGRGKRNPDDHENEWDPDNPWEVAEGVAPVVEAPAESGPIDPGPAIGGRW